MYIPLNLLSIALFTLGSTIPVTAQEAPTKQFQQQDIPLVWIYDEWYQKYGTSIPMFACVCLRQSWDTRPSWPFRSFNMTDTIPALGEYNGNFAESSGFKCVEIPKNEFPILGIGG